jgi:hypothetical protein
MIELDSRVHDGDCDRMPARCHVPSLRSVDVRVGGAGFAEDSLAGVLERPLITEVPVVRGSRRSHVEVRLRVEHIVRTLEARFDLLCGPRALDPDELEPPDRQRLLELHSGLTSHGSPRAGVCAGRVAHEQLPRDGGRGRVSFGLRLEPGARQSRGLRRAALRRDGVNAQPAEGTGDDADRERRP